MSEDQEDTDERPCLHCLIIELVDDFFAQYPVSMGEPDTIDTDEVVTAVAKTVAELTCNGDTAARQTMIKRFSQAAMVRETLRVYETVRARRRAAS